MKSNTFLSLRAKRSNLRDRHAPLGLAMTVCFTFLLSINCPILQAQEGMSARDQSVDDALVKNGGWSGVLPPTGGQVPAALTPSNAGNFINPSFPQAKIFKEVVTRDRSDKKGKVYELKGKVKVAKKGGKDWVDVKKGMIIEEGDVILTEKNSLVSVSLDVNYGNVVHIRENTRAVFKSIEPTDVYIEDGTVYNFFDALPPGKEWKTSSPTAVAAVRGTYYVVHYTSAAGDFFTATLDVPDDGKESKINVVDVKDGKEGGASADVPEGHQMNLTAGQSPDPSLVGDLDPIWFVQIQDILENLASLRSARTLPSTNGEFGVPGGLDAGGADSTGGGIDNQLDPQLDTNSIGSEPEPEPPAEEPPPDESGGQKGGDEGGGDQGCGEYCE